MISYMDLNGDSGISSYSFNENSITIQFKDGSIYLYDYSSTGKLNIEEMKSLAKSGMGLNTFINKFVRKNYSRKIR